MMIKKLYIFAGCAIVAACGGGNFSETTITDVVPPEAQPVIASRIVFQPVDGVLPVPSDLLFSGTTDGTLEPPDESSAKAAGEAVNLANPGAALGGVDGWSTQMPFQVSVATANGTTVDAASVGPTSVLMVQTNCSLGGTGCTSFTPLAYGVDYVAVAGSGSITVVPMKPLAPKTNYIVAFTNGLADSSGNAIAPSELYEQVTSDIVIENVALAGLQAAINGYENIVAAATGAAPGDMIFASSWTTVSVGDAVIATALAVTAGFAPRVSGIAPHSLFATTAAAGGLGIADVYQGSVTLPYFLSDSTASAPSAAITERFTALCDNGVLLSQADPAVLATSTPGANAASCRALGLGDFGLDSERYVTRYNPVAEMKLIKNLDVIITVPNALSGNTGPFPVVMYQHGITSNKETILAIADSLAAAGYAVIAIDLPLHGSRGYDIDSDGIDDINASTVDVTHFMNLTYLLTGKDNLRQSFLDMIGLRMAVQNGFSFDASASISDTDFDRSSLKFIGMSLGGITGTGFTALSASLGMPLEASAFTVSGGGILPLLLDSGGFGPLVQSTVLTGAGLDPATVDAATAASVLEKFAFAAQTIIEGSDPNNYASIVAETPVYMAQVNGDQTIPNQSSFGGLVFGGTTPLANLMGLTQLLAADSAPATSGFVKFTEGYHGTFLDPSASPDASAAATLEMQTQIATFIATGLVVITDAGVVE